MAYFHEVDIEKVEEKADGCDSHRKEHSSKTDDEVVGLLHSHFCSFAKSTAVVVVYVEVGEKEICFFFIVVISLVVIIPDIETVTDHVSHQEEGADDIPASATHSIFIT